MDSLLRQTRVRFSGVGQENKEEITGSNRDKRIPPQKTQSFKGEKKKTHNWFKRQFSRQMSKDYDTLDGDGEYPTAVAAAAFAIKSLEELRITEQAKTDERPNTSLSKTKSKTEDAKAEPGRISRQLSGKPSRTASKAQERRMPAKSEKSPDKAVDPAPSIKKTPTFADKQLQGSKPENADPKASLPFTKQPTLPPFDNQKPGSTKPGTKETEADKWEKAEMAKVKKRYGKLLATILGWENKKKVKAKGKKDKTEADLDRRRAKALQSYREEMKRIDQIAGGARAQAEQNQRNEELKVKEKANRIRTTGKLPATCLCF